MVSRNGNTIFQRAITLASHDPRFLDTSESVNAADVSLFFQRINGRLELQEIRKEY